MGASSIGVAWLLVCVAYVYSHCSLQWTYCNSILPGLLLQLINSSTRWGDLFNSEVACRCSEVQQGELDTVLASPTAEVEEGGGEERRRGGEEEEGGGGGKRRGRAASTRVPLLMFFQNLYWIHKLSAAAENPSSRGTPTPPPPPLPQHLTGWGFHRRRPQHNCWSRCVWRVRTIISGLIIPEKPSARAWAGLEEAVRGGAPAGPILPVRAGVGKTMARELTSGHSKLFIPAHWTWRSDVDSWQVKK